MRCAILVGVFLLVTGFAIGSCEALVFSRDEGTWPKTWPAELEPLRKSSRSIGIATGLQQNIYEIPIPDQVTFDKVWPAVLKIRTPGSPLTLYRTETPPPKAWGDLLSNKRAAIRIYGPSGGYTSKGDSHGQKKPDLEQLVKDGRAARAAEPWPEYLRSEHGELPEWVVATENEEGKLEWIPADPFNKQPGDPSGFYHRARIDIELVIDGKVIDLNRLKLPEAVTVSDRRFE